MNQVQTKVNFSSIENQVNLKQTVTNFQDISCLSLLSLNTDRQDAGWTVNHYQTTCIYSPEVSHAGLRSVTRSFLRSQGYDWSEWKKLNSWYISTLSAEVADQVGLEDTVFSLKKENFLSCNSDLTHAHVLTLKDGRKGVRVYRCGNKYCFTCKDKKRKKNADKLFDVIKELFTQGVIDRVWRFQVTFPEEIAEQAVYDRDLASFLIEKSRKVIKRIFGVKSRSNIGIVTFPHIVGDLDIMKDRFHLHFLVVPCLYDSKTDKFKNVDVKGLIDIEKFRSELCSEFGFDVINPQVRYHPIVWKKKDGAIVWNKSLKRAIEYDARGFGQTFLKSIYRFHNWSYEALIRADYYEQGQRYIGFRIVSLHELAYRWIWLCNQSFSILLSGWLFRYEKIFPTLQEPSYTMNDIQKVEKVTLYRTFERKYDSDLGKVVWDIKEEIEYQGKRLEVGKDIQEIYIEDWNPAKYAFLFPQ